MKYNRIDQVFTMTEMTVDKGYFANREEVLQDIARTGFWPTTYVSEPSPELLLHHHKQDIIGYLTSSQGAKFHGGDS